MHNTTYIFSFQELKAKTWKTEEANDDNTHTNIYIYIYIVIPRETIFLHHNISVWPDQWDVSNQDQNRADLMSVEYLTPELSSILV